MRWQGFAVGILTLTLLEVVVSSQASAQRAGGILNGAANAIRKFIDPTVPAFATNPSGGGGTGPDYGGGPGSFGGGKTGQVPTPGQQQQIQNGLGVPPASTQSAIDNFAATGSLPPGVIAA